MLKAIFVPNIKIACFKVRVKFQIFSFVNCFFILIQSEVLHLYVLLLKQNSLKKSTFKLTDYDYLITLVSGPINQTI